jgi:hypothetical protein
MMSDVEPKQSTKDYGKGYQAGRRYVDSEVLDLRREVRDLQRTAVEKREERIYFKALELVLAHCHGWQMDKKPIDNAQRYSKLAKIFADHAIEHMED